MAMQASAGYSSLMQTPQQSLAQDLEALFDRDAYLKLRPDVGRAGVDPLAHYLEYGWREGVSPHPLFDEEYYAFWELPEWSWFCALFIWRRSRGGLA